MTMTLLKAQALCLTLVASAAAAGERPQPPGALIQIDATGHKVVQARSAQVSSLVVVPQGAGASWDQVDRPGQTMSPQRLQVMGLSGGSFALWIDEFQVGVFRGPELSQGINVAAPARPVTPPRVRHFDLRSVSDVAAAVPAGFSPVFGEGDLNYVLLAAKPQRNLELFLEMDAEGDAGALLLLRGNERGQGYLVTLDGGRPGSVGAVQLVGLKGEGRSPVPNWRPHWKKNDWNAVRVRISGDNALIELWLNGTKLTDWHDPIVQTKAWGRVALRLSRDAKPPHFRNVALKELP